MNNPVLAESLRIAFADRTGKRYLIGYLSACLIASAVVWPFNDLTYFIRIGKEPGSFIAMSILTIIANTVVSVQFSIQQPGRFYTAREWFLMTPVNPATLLAGKIAFAALHSGVLTALAIPYLTVAAAPSGYGMDAVFRISTLIFSVSILIRSICIAVISTGEYRTFVSNAIMWFCVLMLFLPTFKMLPQWNPLLQAEAITLYFSVGFIIRYGSLSSIALVTAFVFLQTAQKRFIGRAHR